MSLKKYLLITVIGSLCMIVLPKYISSSWVDLNNIITVIGYVLISLSSIFTGILLYKQFVSSRVRQKANIKDPIWDEDSLKVCARGAFYKIQNAWESADTSTIKDITTPEFFSDFDYEVKHHHPNEKKVEIGSVDITETNIICCRDYLNNDKDKFATYLKGVLRVYSTTDDRGPFENEFSEIYHFVRSGNDWLLNRITGEAKIINLLFSNSFIQT